VRKLLFILVILSSLVMTSPIVAVEVASDDHTAREEAEGKEIWEKLQAKQLECKNLTNDNFNSLGEYFMGQSIGNTQRHTIMNQMMTNMMGEEEEKQMHITMGKRFSGCDASATIPSSGRGFMPMMNMMMWMLAPWRNFTGMGGGVNPMMGII